MKIPEDTKPKVEIDITNATISAATQEDKTGNKKIDPDKTFKVTFNSNAVVGNKQSKKPKTEVWYFKLESMEERNKWLEVLCGPELNRAEEIKQIVSEDEKSFSSENMEDNELYLNKKGDESSKFSLLPSVLERLDSKIEASRTSVEEMEEIKQYKEYLKHKIETEGWDFKFQKYWSSIIEADKNFDDSIKYSELLIEHVGKFRSIAEFYVKTIINEYHLPNRRYKSLNTTNTFMRLICDVDIKTEIYLIGNALVKLVSKEEKANNESKWKSIGREFLSVDIMFDTLFVLSKPKGDYNLRVPLCCMVDYKGFRGIVYAVFPIKEDSEPILGLNKDGVYNENNTTQLKEQMKSIRNILNLKAVDFPFKKKKVNIDVSPLIEIHQVNNEEETKLSQKIKEVEITELKYNPNTYYVMKTKEIFPIDYDEERQGSEYLRPEFACTFKNPLRNDVKKEQVRLLSSKKGDNSEIMEAKEHLLKVVVGKVIEQLDSLNVMPIDSTSLTRLFHTNGLNMRYLGLVAEHCTLSHVKDLCVIEMLARTIKNIIQYN